MHCACRGAGAGRVRADVEVAEQAHEPAPMDSGKVPWDGGQPPEFDEQLKGEWGEGRGKLGGPKEGNCLSQRHLGGPKRAMAARGWPEVGASAGRLYR